MKKNFKITSLTAAALASVVLASANLNNNAKAAGTAQGEKAATAKKVQSPEDQAKANVESAQKEVDIAQKNVDSSKADLEKAKSEAVKPDQAYKDQEAKKAEADKNAENKKNARDDAAKKQSDAQKLADEATPDAIAKANQAVADKNSEIAQKQQAVKDAQAKQGTAQKNVDDANADVAAKNAALNKANNNKTDADTQVKNAQDALKGTGINEAQQALENANSLVEKDKNDISEANTDITNKTNSKADKDAAQVRAQQEKEQAAQEQQVAQSDYDSKKEISDVANNAVNEKQQEINGVNANLSSLQELSKNTINIGDKDKFLQAIVDYAADKKLTDVDIENIVEARKVNAFVHSDADENETVDLNNLTDEQLKEISLFTSDILSKVRNQLGLGIADDQVTAGAMDVSRKIAQRYLQDFNDGSWKDIDWHDSYGINDVAAKNGLKPHTIKKDGVKQLDTVDQPLEDMSGTYNLGKITTMDKLKGEIYSGLLDMILPSGNGVTYPGQTPTYEMAHTIGLLGVNLDNISDIKKDIKYNEEQLRRVEKKIEDNKSSHGGYTIWTHNGVKYTSEEFRDFLNNENKKLNEKISQLQEKAYHLQRDDMADTQYVAVIPTYFNNQLPTKLHFINISSYQIENNKDFYENATPSYKDQVETATTKKNALSNELETLSADAQEKQNQTYAAESTLNQKKQMAQRKLEEFTKANADYQSAVNALQQAIDHEQQLQDAYEQHQTIQQRAQERYNALTASNKEKTKNLENAQKAQAKAVQEVGAAKTALNTANSNLANAKKAQSDLATDIANKKNAVKTAQNELKDLQARRSQLEGAHQALDDAKEATNQAEKVYREAAKQAADAKAQLDALKPAKDAADAKVKDAQDEYDHAVAKLNDAKAKLDHAKQVLYDLEHPAIYVDDASEVQKPQTQKTVNTSTNEVEKTTPTIKKSTSVKIEFIHNSYVYTLQGKIVKRHGKRYLIRKGHKAVALHNAKIVKINGKKFYQIAKNEYVKVVNTVTATKKINVKAVVKGKKNHKVRTYSSKGKLSRHYVYGQRTYKFTAKKEIKGKTYYKVSGKNEWVPASKLTLK